MDVTVAHHLPQRTRLRVAPPLSPEDAQALADALAAVGGVAEVEVNRRTGSILVAHGPALDTTALVASVRAVAGPAPPPEGERAAEGITGIGREVHRLFVDANRDLRRATDGMLDLGTAATVTLFAAGALEVVATQELPVPPWFNLAWWSFRTFMTTIEQKVPRKEQGHDAGDDRRDT
jgi:hypothetical protein